MNNLNELTGALLKAAPPLDGDGRLLARAVYRELAEGKPVVESQLAIATDTSLGRVQALLAEWSGGVFRNDADDIVGFWGLAVSEMPHRLDIDGVRLYAWCAWDTLFLPGVLGATAKVESSDPSSGELVTLTVTPAGVTERSHPEMMVSFLSPSGEFDESVITSFCHYVHFFTDPDSAASWLATHDQTFLLGLDEAFALGQRWNAGRGLG